MVPVWYVRATSYRPTWSTSAQIPVVLESSAMTSRVTLSLLLIVGASRQQLL